MSEDKKLKRKTAQAKRRFGRFRSALVFVAAATIVGGLAWRAVWWDSRSVDEKLAAIDAELAIPGSENAAAHYLRFFADPNNAAILDDLRDHTVAGYREPWVDAEYPEVAAKLEKHQDFMQALLDISKMPKARFPVYPGRKSDWWKMLTIMRRITFALTWAAANDLAEGRDEAAFGKYRCQFRLAHHLQQQPAPFQNLVGVGLESVAYSNIRTAVMWDGTTPEQLSLFEEILANQDDHDEVDAEIVARVDRLILEKERSQMSTMSTVQRLKYLWARRKALREGDRILRLYRLRYEATRQAIPIFIALRHHKDRTGAWPETLEQIEPKLSEQMLTDPQNNGPFAYKLSGDSFVFYSKGPNGIDEGGSRSGPGDDWPMWPQRKINKTPPGGQ